MLITAYVRIRPEGHREPRNEVGSLSPAERLAGFEPGTFRFLFQRLNPLGHSSQRFQLKIVGILKRSRVSQEETALNISDNSSVNVKTDFISNILLVVI